MFFLLTINCSPLESIPEYGVTTEDSTGEYQPDIVVDWNNHWQDIGEAIGLTETIPDMREVFNMDARSGSGLVSTDLDNDGTIDLVVGRFDQAPLLYWNDGTGYFTADGDRLTLIKNPISPYPAHTTKLGTADINGDSLPDILCVGVGIVFVYPNLGDGQFGEAKVIHTDQNILGLYLSISVGDPDKDDDLDLIITSNAGLNLETGEESLFPDLLLENHGDFHFTVSEYLYSDADTEHTGSKAFVGVFTDFDDDQDQDIFIPKDWKGENALWQNNGAQGWQDVDHQVGADIEWSAMGIESIDLNQDGQLDYCVTDTGPLKCLLSGPDGIFMEGAASLGLSITNPDPDAISVGWTVIANDLDNDGYLDLAHTGGPMGAQENVEIENVPDEIWQGSASGFQYQTRNSNFGDIRDHYGMVQADFDNDGSLEIVIAGPAATPIYYDNIPNSHNWLIIDFEGTGGNIEGWGARITITAGERQWMRELLSTVAEGQGPSEIHLGLGEIETVDTITVRWADGSESRITDIAANQRYTILK